MLTETRPAAGTIDFSYFPVSDGLPMAETEINLEQMIELARLRAVLARTRPGEADVPLGEG